VSVILSRREILKRAAGAVAVATGLHASVQAPAVALSKVRIHPGAGTLKWGKLRDGRGAVIMQTALGNWRVVAVECP
jgi:hypothetical protein